MEGLREESEVENQGDFDELRRIVLLVREELEKGSLSPGELSFF